ncbi:MAG: MoxR family ATPase [Thermodesulfobacteriota bacterium]|nr:MoxR family ATPase [Thermodesulfobacteriota bacterium]
MILEKLGIYGWKEEDENLLLASLLTGDPLLVIGSHGSAKTHSAYKIAEAMGKRFIAYDASKALFEDVLGYPNIEKLKDGSIEYIPSQVTVWDKEMVLVDELNRALPEMQNKWLELIRSRKIMGFPCKVKWVWAAMNPLSSAYSATQVLDDALVGRFAIFVYPPDVLEMNEKDRIRVTAHINGDDAPGLSHWRPENGSHSTTEDSSKAIGERIKTTLTCAAAYFGRLRAQISTLPEFLAKFSDLLMKETKGEIALDGRRLGFIFRNILATRAVELAKGQKSGSKVPEFVSSAKYALQSSIPVGINGQSVNKEELLHKAEICFELLSDYFKQGSEIEKVNRIYELFTTRDVIRKASLLIEEDLSELAKTKAWTDMMNSDEDMTLLAYVALQVEANRPGTIPQELMEALSKKIDTDKLSSSCLAELEGEAIEYIEEIEKLLAQKTDLSRVVAINRVEKLVEKRSITPGEIDETKKLIHQDVQTFEQFLSPEGVSP